MYDLVAFPQGDPSVNPEKAHPGNIAEANFEKIPSPPPHPDTLFSDSQAQCQSTIFYDARRDTDPAVFESRLNTALSRRAVAARRRGLAGERAQIMSTNRLRRGQWDLIQQVRSGSQQPLQKPSGHLGTDVSTTGHLHGMPTTKLVRGRAAVETLG
jgi:hypothetical protein